MMSREELGALATDVLLWAVRTIAAGALLGLGLRLVGF